ncbi:hypothetical protein KC349_g3001 [Hortaea werneckii]|nr:hypothetical protein KC349_g3001 [Hortaea werneckii]
MPLIVVNVGPAGDASYAVESEVACPRSGLLTAQINAQQEARGKFSALWSKDTGEPCTVELPDITPDEWDIYDHALHGEVFCIRTDTNGDLLSKHVRMINVANRLQDNTFLALVCDSLSEALDRVLADSDLLPSSPTTVDAVAESLRSVDTGYIPAAFGVLLAKFAVVDQEITAKNKLSDQQQQYRELEAAIAEKEEQVQGLQELQAQQELSLEIDSACRQKMQKELNRALKLKTEAQEKAQKKDSDLKAARSQIRKMQMDHKSELEKLKRRFLSQEPAAVAEDQTVAKGAAQDKISRGRGRTKASRSSAPPPNIVDPVTQSPSAADKRTRFGATGALGSGVDSSPLEVVAAAATSLGPNDPTGDVSPGHSPRKAVSTGKRADKKTTSVAPPGKKVAPSEKKASVDSHPPLVGKLERGSDNSLEAGFTVTGEQDQAAHPSIMPTVEAPLAALGKRPVAVNRTVPADALSNTLSKTFAANDTPQGVAKASLTPEKRKHEGPDASECSLSSKKRAGAPTVTITRPSAGRVLHASERFDAKMDEDEDEDASQDEDDEHDADDEQNEEDRGSLDLSQPVLEDDDELD